jgi:sugar/nucleoside kinase (ribokinase family)
MDVIGIGLSNIDLVARVNEAFLAKHKLRKGAAVKVDELSFARLRAELTSYDAIPGGCAANTICGLAVNGVSCGFFGKIGSDSFESLYRASFRDYGVIYDVVAGSKESSQCAVLVTEDGERSFAYMDGASWDLGAADIDQDALEKAALIYAEIYLFEFGRNNDAAKNVFDIAAKYKKPLAIKVLEDAAFGRKYAQKLRTMAEAGVLTFLVGNEASLSSLVSAASLDEAIAQLGEWPCQILMTAGRDGAYHLHEGELTHQPVEPVETPKNTTGAGDQFVAGFLAGWLDKQPVQDCLRHGTACARIVINHDTPRPPLVTRHSIAF